MTYEWFMLGDQDECTRKICCLGPYLLEHKEEFWSKEKMYMRSRVYLWNDLEKGYDEVETTLPYIEYNRLNSHLILEDWYAEHVLLEQLCMGVDNGQTNSEKLQGQ